MTFDDTTTLYEESFIKTINTQEITWTQINNGQTLKLELINPLRAKVSTFKGTKYVKFLVQALENNEDPAITKDSVLFVNFPLKTWERAMYSISLSKKSHWHDLGEDNIQIEFTKEGKTIMKFSEIERVEITEEQKEFVKKYMGG